MAEIARGADRHPHIPLTFRPRVIALAATIVAAAVAVVGMKSVSLGDADRSTSAPPVSVDGSCAAVIIFQGQRYLGHEVKVRPVEGEAVGQATVPACTDQGQPAGDDQRVGVAAIAGVAPDVALTRSGKAVFGRGDLYIREGIPASELPKSVTSLLLWPAPSCERDDEPITLSGRWLGITGADVADMTPPYEVRLDVLRSSAQRYERADLTVLVPEALGRPLSADDLRNSLWQNGKITVTAVCRDGRFVATRVVAKPPD